MTQWTLFLFFWLFLWGLTRRDAVRAKSTTIFCKMCLTDFFVLNSRDASILIQKKNLVSQFLLSISLKHNFADSNWEYGPELIKNCRIRSLSLSFLFVELFNDQTLFVGSCPSSCRFDQDFFSMSSPKIFYNFQTLRENTLKFPNPKFRYQYWT